MLSIRMYVCVYTYVHKKGQRCWLGSISSATTAQQSRPLPRCHHTKRGRFFVKLESFPVPKAFTPNFKIQITFKIQILYTSRIFNLFPT